MGEADTDSLRAAFDAASTYADWATIAVTAGVFIEFVALFVFGKEMPPAEKRVMIFATLLIVFGCGGEFIFGGRASKAAAELQQASDEKVATANLNAEEAKKSAAEAELALKKFKAPRDLSAWSRSNVADAIRKFRDTKFALAVAPGDPEAFALMLKIASALEDGDWEWVDWNPPGAELAEVYSIPNKPNIGQAVPVAGVDVSIPPGLADKFGAPAIALVNALNAEGLQSQPIASKGPNPEAIPIIIGKKP